MRGYPPIHLLLLMLAFGAMAVPLVNLTTARTATVAAPKLVQASSLHATHLEIRFAHKPATVSLTMGGEDILSGAQTHETRIEARCDLAIPAEGIEFILSAKWPDGTPDTAMTLEIEPDGLDTKTETRWSTGAALTEVISFQWK